jgi:class 3 adenylate cyclase
MLVSLKNRLLSVENMENGSIHTVLLAFEDDMTLSVTDAESEIPAFCERVTMDRFPSDAAICECISRVLRFPCRIHKALDRNMELDNSALSGLKKMPVDIFDNVYLDEVKNDALVLCVDIRSFSNFLCSNPEEKVFKLIKDFTSNFLSCVNQFAFGCSYYKLLGDGALVIWDKTDEQTVNEAISVFDIYLDFLSEELFQPYPALGLAGALVTDKVFKYEISAEASQLKYRDYVGYGINLACRLQGLAEKGQLIINENLARTGLVMHTVEDSPDRADLLHHLKGLREEDCSRLYFYVPNR